MNKYEEILKGFQEVHDGLPGMLTSQEDSIHLLKLQAGLRQSIGYLQLITGSNVSSEAPVRKLDAATTFMGEPLVTPQNKAATVADLKPGNDKVASLKARVEEAFGVFMTTTDAEILSTMDPMVIRGVAKKAGLVVKSDDEVTMQYIVDIKAEITKEAEEQKQRLEKRRDELVPLVADAWTALETANGEFNKATLEQTDKKTISRLEGAANKAARTHGELKEELDLINNKLNPDGNQN